MDIFGGMPDAVKFVIVFLVILGILVPLLWRRFNVGPLGASAQRSRQRLAVIDTAAVDVRRKLVLVKRDNVEHLLMIGGPTDIVVESNIGRMPAAVREPRPIPDARPDAARQAEAAEWPLPLEPVVRPVRTVDLDAALPEPPARTAREAMVDSMRAVRSVAAARRGPPIDFDNPPEEVAAPALTPSPAPEVHHRPPRTPDHRQEPRRPAAAVPPDAQRPQPEPVPHPPIPQSPVPPAADAPEPKRERAAPAAPRPVQPVPVAPAAPAGGAAPPPTRPVPTAAAANAPPPRPVQPVPAAAAGPVPPPRPTPSDESNLAEMAQRLEAALRRPTRPEPPPPPARPQLRPEPPAGRKPVNPDAATPAKVSVRSPDAPQPDLKVLPGRGKNESAMDSLEDEMAKMLGRPGKS
jgi:hypothetical protein